jgi:hypothetical protein
MAPWETQKISPRTQAPYLWGFIHGGCNYDENWLAAYLLSEMSQISNVAASVWDVDGQFLLIEAAMLLPKWIQPKYMDHRVFIRGGKVHLVPLQPVTTPTSISPPSVENVLNMLWKDDVVTRANHNVQACIERRLVLCPQKAKTDTLVIKVMIPPRVAHILTCVPQLISSVVLALRYEKTQNTKYVGRIRQFATEVIVPVDLKMNKLHFLQLMREEITPMKDYPPYHLSKSIMSKAGEIGQRITMGMEIMCYSLSKDAVTKWTKENLLDQNLPVDCGRKLRSMLHEPKATASWTSILYMLPGHSHTCHGPRYPDKILSKYSIADLPCFLMNHAEEMWPVQQGNRKKEVKSRDTFCSFAAQQFVVEPMDIVNEFDAFLSAKTALEGIDTSEDMDLSYKGFFRNLSLALGIPFLTGMSNDNVGSLGMWSDSDIDHDDELFFDRNSGNGLDRRYKSRTREQEFDRIGRSYDSQAGKIIEEPSNFGTDQRMSKHMTPDSVALGTNLVKSLLQSYDIQSDTTGPTDILVGISGLLLPKYLDNLHLDDLD